MSAIVSTPVCHATAPLRGGSAACACLTTLSGFGIPEGARLAARIDGGMYSFDPQYGLGGCGAHDAFAPPFCDARAGRASIPSFCLLDWCYINRSDCSAGVESAPSTYDFPGITPSEAQFLHYSYDTCNVSDLFTCTPSAGSSCGDGSGLPLWAVLIVSRCPAQLPLVFPACPAFFHQAHAPHAHAPHI